MVLPGRRCCPSCKRFSFMAVKILLLLTNFLTLRSLLCRRWPMTDVLCFFKRRRQRMEQAKANNNNNKWPTVSLPTDNRKCFLINQPIVDAIGELSLLSHFYNKKNKAGD
ncbi:conserved hypothetical protein [Trichinella spiralis]|uniref:hypothetical protein n=1 Tax=Trichinella spiralis TaxID=6334 RepID=UPI0001EFB7CC|nr:conserved hypothetical protein [Trichinella spiralis]